LQLLTVDLTALPPQKVQSGSGRSKKKGKAKGTKAAATASKDTAQYYKWITVAIDAFSRYAWVGVLDPMVLRDDGSGPTASKHWESFAPVLNDIRILNGDTLEGVQIQTDNGNEMLGRFSNELKRRKVRQTLGKPGAPASQSHAERLMMTLKRRMNRIWRARGVATKKPWNAELLAAVVAGYNNSVHSALPNNYTPADVMDALFDDPTGIIDKVKAHQDKIAGRKKTQYEQAWTSDKTSGAFEVGDVVRKRSVQPGKWDTHYSVTLYDVISVQPSMGVSKPTTYRLRRHSNRNADEEPGNFTARDIQRVPLDGQRKPIQHKPDAALFNLELEDERDYRPQRIVEERGQAPNREFLIRWKGYPPSAATWEKETSDAAQAVIGEWDASVPK
jgi:hypothetical protein